MTTKSLDTIELIKILLTIVMPFLASFITFVFYVKGKKKDVQLSKLSEINIVLSNLLIVWYNFKILSKICDSNFYNKLKLPFTQRRHVLLHLKLRGLKEENFTELDESVKDLRKYDPILFYSLEDIGNRLNFLLNNVIILLIKNAPNGIFPTDVILKYLNDIIKELEQSIIESSEHLDKANKTKIKKKLELKFINDVEKTREEFNTTLYKLIVLQEKNLTYEQFLKDLEIPDCIDYFNNLIDQIIQAKDFNELIEQAKIQSEMINPDDIVSTQ
ncbi:hypothetical protein ACWA1C_12745 [Flectobacillus roseus]